MSKAKPKADDLQARCDSQLERIVELESELTVVKALAQKRGDALVTVRKLVTLAARSSMHRDTLNLTTIITAALRDGW